MRVKIKKNVLGEEYLIYVEIMPKQYKCKLWLCANTREFLAEVNEDFTKIVLSEEFILKGYGEAINEGGLIGYGKSKEKNIEFIKLSKMDSLRVKECILNI